MSQKSLALDPRSKLILVFSVAVVLGTLNHWPFLLATAGILLVFTGWLGQQKSMLRFFQGLGPAVLGFFVVAWLAFDLSLALTAASRLLSLGLVFFLFFQTTSPKDLSQALVHLGLPYSIGFVLTVSMEFIPVLARRAANIRDAQRSRGIPVGFGWRGLRFLPALLGPLLIQAFKLADEMAEALEARGFGASGRRPSGDIRFRALDWLIVSLSLGALSVYLLFRFF